MTRFLENHNEARAAVTISPEVHLAAAVITSLSPGLRFFHQGRFLGRKKRLSSHLAPGPDEPVDADVGKFYDRLLALRRQPIVRQGSGNCSNACLPREASEYVGTEGQAVS